MTAPTTHELYVEWDRLKKERSAIARRIEDVDLSVFVLGSQREGLVLDAEDLDRAIAEVREELGES